MSLFDKLRKILTAKGARKPSFAEIIASNPDIAAGQFVSRLPGNPEKALKEIVERAENGIYTPRDAWLAINAYNAHFKTDLAHEYILKENATPLFNAQMLEALRSDTQTYADMPFAFGFKDKDPNEGVYSRL